MADTTRYARDADRVPDTGTPDPLDPKTVLGMWWNTNRRTWGISRAELTERDGQVWMRVWAVDPARAEPHDWGEVVVERLYADGPHSDLVCGYTATFDLGHARTHIQANQSHSLTVLAALTTFTDDSGRRSYFSREFYHRRG